MQREFRHYLMTNIQRVGHSPHEIECIAHLLVLRMVLICVAHAAQETWRARKMVSEDPANDLIADGIRSLPPAETGDDRRDLSDTFRTPRPALWEITTGLKEWPCAFRAGPVLPAGTELCAADSRSGDRSRVRNVKSGEQKRTQHYRLMVSRGDAPGLPPGKSPGGLRRLFRIPAGSNMNASSGNDLNIQ